MVEQLRGLFEKFVDWQWCTAVMLSCRGRHDDMTTAPLLRCPDHYNLA